MSLTERLYGVVSGEGSTRPAALLRVGLALVVWSRFAFDFAAFHRDHPWTWSALGGSVLVASTLMLVGWRSRLTTLWTGLSIAAIVLYLGVGQKQYALLHHHVSLLLIAVLLLALTPCGGSLSLDRWRAVQRARADGRPPPPERGPQWGVRLIALQMSAVYLWGAVDKTSAAWLSGDRLQAILMAQYSGSDWPTLPGFAALCTAGAVATVALEYFLAVALWRARWLPWLIPTVVVFHGVLFFFLPVATFSATMYVLLAAFLPADATHRGVDALLGHGPLDAAAPTPQDADA